MSYHLGILAVFAKAWVQFRDSKVDSSQLSATPPPAEIIPTSWLPKYLYRHEHTCPLTCAHETNACERGEIKIYLQNH